MPPKKGKVPDGEPDYNDVLRYNLKRGCNLLGCTLPPAVESAVTGEAGGDPSAPIPVLCVDGEAGPEAIRALCAALLCKGAGMKQPPYKHLKELRIWRAKPGEDGLCALAELLVQSGPSGLPIELLEVLQCGITSRGALRLSQSLMLGGNSTLKSLSLDMNPSMGPDGLAHLCRGLALNRSVGHLSLAYCGIGADGAAVLAEALASPLCAVGSLNLTGNPLGPEGLLHLCLAGKMVGPRLTSLVLTGARIGGGSEETPGMLAEALKGAGDLSGAANIGGAAASVAASMAGLRLAAAAEAGGEESVAGMLARAARLTFVAAGLTPAPSAAAEQQEDDDDDDGSEGAGAAAQKPKRTALGPDGTTQVPLPAAVDLAAFAERARAHLQRPLAPLAPGTPAAGKRAQSAGAEAQAQPLELGIPGVTPATVALCALGELLADPNGNVQRLALDLNGLTPKEAGVLAGYVGEAPRLAECKVDTTLPPELFAALCRAPAPAKKGGKKK